MKLPATRFNPSCNGPLHLGHIYMALVNEAFAKERNGKFIVRWDDSHPHRIASMGEERIARIQESQANDLEWLGIFPDEHIKQSDVVGDVRETIRISAIPKLQDEPEPITPLLIGDVGVIIYPLTPALTLEKVILDHREGVTHLVRGVDLLSEFSLYQFYCRDLGYPQPRHIYIPRLAWQHGDMSKTTGARTVSGLRSNGYTPQDVRAMVKDACLRLVPNGWQLDNIKGVPYL